MTTTSTRLSLKTVFERMQLIRRFEERMLARHGAEVVGSVHPATGQEAIAVGGRSALSNEDLVVATYRGHHWAIACGVAPAELFAEVMGRASGTNGGRGGSAYLSAPEHGFVGENSIVGAGLPIADGLALASQLRSKGRIVAVAFGDGATNQGAAYEAIVFAIARQLPIVFICENNRWSEMTPIEAIVPVELADRTRAMGIPAVQVDGTDVFAVAAEVERAAHTARSGKGPTFVECLTRRLIGHYQADMEHYRPGEDRELAAAADALARARALLVENEGEEAASEIERRVDSQLEQAEGEALAAVLPKPGDATRHVYSATPSGKARALPTGGTTMTYLQAVNAALRAELAARPDALFYGEDVAIPGGVFGASKNLLKEFGGDRVFDTPISEAAILGSAVGAAIAGMRPIVEVMYGDFLLVALDQLVNQAANVSYLSRGSVTCPLVVRTQQGATPGSCAQHSQSLEALLAHIPGMRVGVPSRPQDAYAMLRAAVASDDPVILYESRALYPMKGEVDLAGHEAEIGGARLLREGADVALVTWGRMTHTVEEAAIALDAQGVSAAVLDLRWLDPLDEELLFHTVRNASRLLVVHEANLTGGFGAEVVARASSECFHDLDGPPRRIGLPDVRMPAAPSLYEALLPSAQTIVDAALELVA